MKNHIQLKSLVYSFGVALLAATGLVLAWLATVTTPTLAENLPDGSVSASRSHQIVPTPTPRPIWNSVTPPGSSGRLPSTSWFGAHGAPPRYCMADGIPEGVQYWEPLSNNGQGSLATTLLLGIPDEPASIFIVNCGSVSGRATTFTLMQPDGTLIQLPPSANGDLYYTLRPDSEEGPYIVEISSPLGNISVDYFATQDTQPHIYVHDAITGDSVLDPNHPVKIDYINFTPNITQTIGLYRAKGDDPDPQAHLISAWQIMTDDQGSYSEVVAAPTDFQNNAFRLMACKTPTCTSKEDLEQVTIELVASGIAIQDRDQLTPQETVKEYLINTGNATGWSMLTQNFRDKFYRNAAGESDFAEYAYQWNVASVSQIGTIETLASTADTATVLVPLVLESKDGTVTLDQSPRIQLVWDAETERWLLDDKGP